MRFLGLSFFLVVFLSACGGEEPQADAAAESSPAPAASNQRERVIAGTEPLPSELHQAVRDVLGPIYQGIDNVRYAASATDLNGDGHPEILVYPMGPMVCGSGGCDLLVLAKREGRFALHSRTSVVQTPIFLSETKSHGWNDLVVTVGGGGVVGEPLRRLRVQDERYTANASLADAASADQRGPLLLAAGIDVAQASPLSASEDAGLSPLERYAGRYQGVLPCASCPGIETELVLQAQGRFELLEVYREQGDEPFMTLGQWQLAEGAENVFVLTPDDQSEAPRYFELDDQGATALDSSGQAIESDQPLRLAREGGDN